MLDRSSRSASSRRAPRLGRVVLAQVLLTTGERVLAEEIVQDTMLAVCRGGSVQGESSVRSWVIAIARRQTRDRLRGRRPPTQRPRPAARVLAGWDGRAYERFKNLK